MREIIFNFPQSNCMKVEDGPGTGDYRDEISTGQNSSQNIQLHSPQGNFIRAKGGINKKKMIS